jgi:hypothetical protein
MNTNLGAPIPRSNKVNELDDQLTDITNTLHDNINKTIGNTTQLNSLEEKTHILKNDSKHFYKQSNKVKYKMKMKYLKCIVIVVVVIILFIVLI